MKTQPKFPWIKNGRFLVTGGCGFIGSHIVKALSANGASEIHVLDNLYTGFEKNISGTKINFHRNTILNRELVDSILSQVTTVFHLAAIPSVPRSILDPIKTFEVNVQGTLTLLESARKNQIKKFIFSSSSSIYGGLVNTVSRHEEMHYSVLSPYAAQKLSSEAMCIAYAKSFGMNTVCLRYFNIFGPFQVADDTYSAVIPKFLKLAIDGKTIELQGDGKQSRDFTYVENAVNANLLASNPELMISGEIFNVGCEANCNLLELIQKIEGLVGKPLNVKRVDGRVGDPKFSKADITKSKKLLGYQPVIDLDEGLKKTYEHIKDMK